MSDLWPVVADEVGNGVRDAYAELMSMTEELPEGLLHELEARWRAGAAEHGDAWTDWPRERFILEARAELLDLVLYSAMRRGRYGY